MQCKMSMSFVLVLWFNAHFLQTKLILKCCRISQSPCAGKFMSPIKRLLHESVVSDINRTY